MAISIDYSTFTINVPRADLTLIQPSPEVRQLDLDAFRLELNSLMESDSGMTAPTNHRHTAPLTVAGVTLARVVEVLDPYSITFEDGFYAVNVVGGNSNIADRINPNSVGVNTANSAGLQDTTVIAQALAEAIRTRKHVTNRYETDPDTGLATLYDDDGTTPIESAGIFEDVAGTIPYRGSGVERRNGFG